MGEAGRDRTGDVAVYRLLLKSYPRAFREDYGDAMVQHFSDLLLRRHPGSRAAVWRLAVPDLVLTSVYERKESFVQKGAWKVILPLVVLAVGVSAVIGGAHPAAMVKVLGIVLVAMAALGGAAFFVGGRINRPAESGGFARHWWTFASAAVAVSYVAIVGREFVSNPSSGSLVSLLVSLGFAGLIAGGLYLRSRGKTPAGNWLVIFGSAPALPMFWFIPTLVLGCLSIIGALSELLREARLTKLSG